MNYSKFPKAKKNIYSIKFYDGNRDEVFFEFANYPLRCINDMEKWGRTWTHAVLYNRKTRLPLDRFYRKDCL